MTFDLWQVTIEKSRKSPEVGKMNYSGFVAFVKAKDYIEAFEIAKDYCDFMSINNYFSFKPLSMSSQVQKQKTTYRLNDIKDFYLRIWYKDRHALIPPTDFNMHHAIEELVRTNENCLQRYRDVKAVFEGAVNTLYRKKQFNRDCNQVLVHDYGVLELKFIEAKLKHLKKDINRLTKEIGNIYNKIINDRFSKKEVQRYQKCKSLFEENSIFVNIGGLEMVSES